MKATESLLLSGAGLAAVALAPSLPGKTSIVVRVGGLIAAVAGAFLFMEALREEGGIAGLLGGVLGGKSAPPVQPIDEGTIPPDPIVNPGAPHVDFLALRGQILSPLDDSVLHARAELTLDGTYPVDLVVTNGRDTPAEGFIKVRTVEETIFQDAVNGGLVGPPMTLAPHSFQRVTLHVACASGRIIVGAKINARVEFQQNDGRVRDFGSVDFILQ